MSHQTGTRWSDGLGIYRRKIIFLFLINYYLFLQGGNGELHNNMSLAKLVVEREEGTSRKMKDLEARLTALENEKSKKETGMAAGMRNIETQSKMLGEVIAMQKQTSIAVENIKIELASLSSTRPVLIPTTDTSVTTPLTIAHDTLAKELIVLGDKLSDHIRQSSGSIYLLEESQESLLPLHAAHDAQMEALSIKCDDLTLNNMRVREDTKDVEASLESTNEKVKELATVLSELTKLSVSSLSSNDKNNNVDAVSTAMNVLSTSTIPSITLEIQTQRDRINSMQQDITQLTSAFTETRSICADIRLHQQNATAQAVASSSNESDKVNLKKIVQEIVNIEVQKNDKKTTNLSDKVEALTTMLSTDTTGDRISYLESKMRELPSKDSTEGSTDLFNEVHQRIDELSSALNTVQTVTDINSASKEEEPVALQSDIETLQKISSLSEAVAAIHKKLVIVDEQQQSNSSSDANKKITEIMSIVDPLIRAHKSMSEKLDVLDANRHLSVVRKPPEIISISLGDKEEITDRLSTLETNGSFSIELGERVYAIEKQLGSVCAKLNQSEVKEKEPPQKEEEEVLEKNNKLDKLINLIENMGSPPNTTKSVSFEVSKSVASPSPVLDCPVSPKAPPVLDPSEGLQRRTSQSPPPPDFLVSTDDAVFNTHKTQSTTPQLGFAQEPSAPSPLPSHLSSPVVFSHPGSQQQVTPTHSHPNVMMSDHRNLSPFRNPISDLTPPVTPVKTPAKRQQFSAKKRERDPRPSADLHEEWRREQIIKQSQNDVLPVRSPSPFEEVVLSDSRRQYDELCSDLKEVKSERRNLEEDLAAVCSQMSTIQKTFQQLTDKQSQAGNQNPQIHRLLTSDSSTTGAYLRAELHKVTNDIKTAKHNVVEKEKILVKEANSYRSKIASLREKEQQLGNACSRLSVLSTLHNRTASRERSRDPRSRDRSRSPILNKQDII